MLILRIHIFCLFLYLLHILFFNQFGENSLGILIQITTFLVFLYIIKEIFIAWYSGVDSKTNQPLDTGKIVIVGSILLFLLLPSLLLSFFKMVESKVLSVTINFVAMLFSYLIIKIGDTSEEVEE